MMPFEPLVLDTLPGAEITGLAALAGVTVVASFALNYAFVRLFLEWLKSQQSEREVRAKEAEAMRAAQQLAAEVLRDRRAG